MNAVIDRACARLFADRVNAIMDEKGYPPLDPSPAYRARMFSETLLDEHGLYIRYDRVVSLLKAEKLATISELGAFEQVLGPIWAVAKCSES